MLLFTMPLEYIVLLVLSLDLVRFFYRCCDITYQNLISGKARAMSIKLVFLSWIFVLIFLGGLYIFDLNKLRYRLFSFTLSRSDCLSGEYLTSYMPLAIGDYLLLSVSLISKMLLRPAKELIFAFWMSSFRLLLSFKLLVSGISAYDAFRN